MMFIRPNICAGCSLCYQECPFHAIIRIERNHYEISDKCRSCGVCFEACPMDAIIQKTASPTLTK